MLPDDWLGSNRPEPLDHFFEDEPEIPAYLQRTLDLYFEMFPSEGKLVRLDMDDALDHEGITSKTRRKDLRTLWRALDGERLKIQSERIEAMRRESEVRHAVRSR